MFKTKHLVASPVGSLLPAIVMLAVSSILPVPAHAEGIVAVKENGHTIYVNNDGPSAPAQNPAPRATRHSVLVYWSRTENRWKPVPPPSPSAMRKARFAAAEVIAGMPAPSSGTRQQQVDNLLVSSEQVNAAIEAAAAKHGVDPNLVRAVIKVESNGNPRAVSNKGAMGLMQLMPQTARTLNVSNPFDPQQNVDAGVRHLRRLLDNYGGDVKLSLAAYNAGEKAVTRNGGVPPYTETRNYVKRITEIYGNNNGWMGHNGAPIKTYRDSQGVLNISNTD